jgi:hypothetical protein
LEKIGKQRGLVRFLGVPILYLFLLYCPFLPNHLFLPFSFASLRGKSTVWIPVISGIEHQSPRVTEQIPPYPQISPYPVPVPLHPVPFPLAEALFFSFTLPHFLRLGNREVATSTGGSGTKANKRNSNWNASPHTSEHRAIKNQFGTVASDEPNHE